MEINGNLAKKPNFGRTNHTPYVTTQSNQHSTHILVLMGKVYCENINREINGRVQRCGHLLAHAEQRARFIMALLKYFKKSSVLPNPHGQQTKKLSTVAPEVVIHVSAVTPVAVTYHSSNLCRTTSLVHLQ